MRKPPKLHQRTARSLLIESLLMLVVGTGLFALLVFNLPSHPKGAASEKHAQSPVPSLTERTAEIADTANTLAALGFGALILTGLAAVGTGAFFLIRHLRRRRKVTKEAASFIAMRSEASIKRHGDLANEYAAYLFDLTEIFKRPALNDPSFEYTAAFLDAYYLLGPVPDRLLSQAEVELHEVRVSAAWKAWRQAEAKATKLGLRAFSTAERRKVERAQSLLAIALDAGASEFERAQAYQQVKKLIDGLIRVPAPVFTQIEADLQLALSSQPNGSSSGIALTPELASPVVD